MMISFKNVWRIHLLVGSLAIILFIILSLCITYASKYPYINYVEGIKVIGIMLTCMMIYAAVLSGLFCFYHT